METFPVASDLRRTDQSIKHGDLKSSEFDSSLDPILEYLKAFVEKNEWTPESGLSLEEKDVKETAPSGPKQTVSKLDRVKSCIGMFLEFLQLAPTAEATWVGLCAMSIAKAYPIDRVRQEVTRIRTRVEEALVFLDGFERQVPIQKRSTDRLGWVEQREEGSSVTSAFVKSESDGANFVLEAERSRAAQTETPTISHTELEMGLKSSGKSSSRRKSVRLSLKSTTYQPTIPSELFPMRPIKEDDRAMIGCQENSTCHTERCTSTGGQYTSNNKNSNAGETSTTLQEENLSSSGLSDRFREKPKNSYLTTEGAVASSVKKVRSSTAQTETPTTSQTELEMGLKSMGKSSSRRKSVRLSLKSTIYQPTTPSELFPMRPIKEDDTAMIGCRENSTCHTELCAGTGEQYTSNNKNSNAEKTSTTLQEENLPSSGLSDRFREKPKNSYLTTEGAVTSSVTKVISSTAQTETPTTLQTELETGLKSRGKSSSRRKSVRLSLKSTTYQPTIPSELFPMRPIKEDDTAMIGCRENSTCHAELCAGTGEQYNSNNKNSNAGKSSTTLQEENLPSSGLSDRFREKPKKSYLTTEGLGWVEQREGGSSVTSSFVKSESDGSSFVLQAERSRVAKIETPNLSQKDIENRLKPIENSSSRRKSMRLALKSTTNQPTIPSELFPMRPIKEDDRAMIGCQENSTCHIERCTGTGGQYTSNNKNSNAGETSTTLQEENLPSSGLSDRFREKPKKSYLTTEGLGWVEQREGGSSVTSSFVKSESDGSSFVLQAERSRVAKIETPNLSQKDIENRLKPIENSSSRRKSMRLALKSTTNQPTIPSELFPMRPIKEDDTAMIGCQENSTCHIERCTSTGGQYTSNNKNSNAGETSTTLQEENLSSSGLPDRFREKPKNSYLTTEGAVTSSVTKVISSTAQTETPKTSQTEQEMGLKSRGKSSSRKKSVRLSLKSTTYQPGIPLEPVPIQFIKGDGIASTTASRENVTGHIGRCAGTMGSFSPQNGNCVGRICSSTFQEGTLPSSRLSDRSRDKTNNSFRTQESVAHVYRVSATSSKPETTPCSPKRKLAKAELSSSSSRRKSMRLAIKSPTHIVIRSRSMKPIVEEAIFYSREVGTPNDGRARDNVVERDGLLKLRVEDTPKRPSDPIPSAKSSNSSLLRKKSRFLVHEVNNAERISPEETTETVSALFGDVVDNADAVGFLSSISLNQ